MKVLVAHASKHRATAGIAERIGSGLAAAGHDVDVRPVDEIEDPSGYDAFVVGSAVYFEHWMKHARVFVQANAAVLAAHPSWPFSSGPIGPDQTDEHGVDLRQVSDPAELSELLDAVHPRQHRVFFGALDPAKLTFPERVIRKLPAGREMLPKGDFRDWSDVDRWSAEIAEQLNQLQRRPAAPTPAAVATRRTRGNPA